MKPRSLMLSTKFSDCQTNPLRQTHIFVASAKYELSVCTVWVAMHPHCEISSQEEIMFPITNHFFLSFPN